MQRLLISNKDMEGIDNMVNLKEETFEYGLVSYKIEINPEIIQECSIHDQAWDREFKKHVADNYPYTMSPETTRLIASASTELKKKMHDAGFNLESWIKLTESESYVMGVLRRVMITDTIEPIIGYTDEMAIHLANLKTNSPDKLIHIRSFFSWRFVADKCLIVRLHQMGVFANLLATDMSADSIAIGALNFEVWNLLLAKRDRYEIHIVNGDVPHELMKRDKTIVLQVGDAMKESKNDSLHSVKFDALLIDNGLQYIDASATKEIVSNVLKNKGDRGLYIGTLGLDSNIRVKISPFTHLKEIFKVLLGKNLADLYKKTYFSHPPYGYLHNYKFKLDKDNQILITRVYSSGAVRMYTWLTKLLKDNIPLFIEVMKAMKSAISLSKANVEVVTTPFEYHQAMLDAIKENNLEYVVFEKPLNYESFGWLKVEGQEDTYTNGKEEVNGSTMMEKCKKKDPVVLRISRILAI